MFKSNKFQTNGNTNNTVTTQNNDNKQELLAYEEEPVVFSTSAFSVVFDGRQWQTVEIPIDPVTKQTGQWIYHPEDGTKMGSQERFKIAVARKLFA